MYISFAVLFALAVASQPISNKRFRKDYEYNPKTDAFYKLHIERVWNNRAKKVCSDEGAQLMLPAAKQDIVQLHGMIKQFPDIGDYVWVGNDGLAHESAEEQPIINLEDPTDYTLSMGGQCEVVSRQGDAQSCPCYRLLPFICKVEAKNAIYNTHCDVAGVGYQYKESVGSCYKISRFATSWGHAYDECRNEGSHLLVINSVAEQQIIYNITNSAPPVVDSNTSWFFFVGVRAHKTTAGTPGVFNTIFNETLDKAGFNEWSPGEPNNALGKEFCGTFFKNDAKYNDLDCSYPCAFICEKEIKLHKV